MPSVRDLLHSHQHHNYRTIILQPYIIFLRTIFPSSQVVLVYGSVLMNEAALTGESTPMEKESIGNEQTPVLVTKNKSNYLFAGTDVISVTSHVSSTAQQDICM